MKKYEMIAALDSKIMQLEVAIKKGKDDEKSVGRLKRQVRPLYVIKTLVEIIDNEEIIMGACQKDFNQLIECSKGHTKYEFEEGMTVNELLATYSNLSFAKMNEKLEKAGLKLDLAKGVVVKA